MKRIIAYSKLEQKNRPKLKELLKMLDSDASNEGNVYKYVENGT